MREIKFRAINANLPPHWIYGYFVIENGSCLIINNDGVFKVISGTQCQYAGLKDKNKIDIYEGDIIKEYVPPNEVIYKEGTFGIYELTSFGRRFVPLKAMQIDGVIDCDILGNIYENSELLKETKCDTEKSQ